MIYTKEQALIKAVEIAKEYARGGGSSPIPNVIKQVYDMLNRLSIEASEE
jgi:hypothetical protein